jgi:hypothetical protein
MVYHMRTKPCDAIRQLEQPSVVQGMEVTPEQDSILSFVLSGSPISAAQVGRLERFRDIAAGNSAATSVRREYGPCGSKRRRR